MRIPSFEIRNERSIRFAKCEQVPQLMLIAGPNGAGKSTLLDALRRVGGYHNIMYLGPHRAMRRQTVQQRHLISAPISIEEILTRQDVQGFEGIQLFGGARDPWSYDDSANYLKHGLCQVEVERTQAIAARYDRFGEIPRGSLVDPWQPLRELTHNLLPHLSFSQIDAINRNQIRCLWQVHTKDILVDIDDLSSGEKSIIQMFYPLIEHEIKRLLADIQGVTLEEHQQEICVLIDEPELHLHPNLQVKVLDYMRVLTAGKNTQVIFTTQSPTIVENANFEELFVLRPPELVGAEENQLAQVADNEERLRILREIFGTTSNLTALQPVIIVESISEKDTTRVIPDRKLYRALHSGFDTVTLLGGGGKGQAKALLEVLQDALQTFSSHLQAIALLDRDYSGDLADGRIRLLPVSMIENFLLDPDSIWEAIQSVIERTGFRTVDDIAQAIDAILDELEQREMERRVMAKLGLAYFRPHSPLAEIQHQLEAFERDFHIQFSPENINNVVNIETDYVNGLKRANRRREEFHGKTVLDEFYKRHLHSSGMAKGIFTFEAARHARRRKSVVNYFEELFAGIKK